MMGKAVHFFNALFIGHHDTKLVDTGAPFVPDYSGLSSYLKGLGSLLDMDKAELETDMTLDELRENMKESANFKSPGLHGISYEFYKVRDAVQNIHPISEIFLRNPPKIGKKSSQNAKKIQIRLGPLGL